MKILMKIDENVTSNGGSEEKVAKSRGPSEGDGGGRNHVGGIHNEQGQARNIRSTTGNSIRVWHRTWVDILFYARISGDVDVDFISR